MFERYFYISSFYLNFFMILYKIYILNFFYFIFNMLQGRILLDIFFSIKRLHPRDNYFIFLQKMINC